MRPAVLTGTLLALVAAPAWAEAPTTADRTAAYRLAIDHGAVRAVEILPKGGGRIVADVFVSDPGSLRSEAAALGSTVCSDDACRSGCGYARLARPFRRLTRYDAAGRRLWTWRVKDGAGAVQLLGRPGADCLSPDGRYLTVELYDLQGEGADATAADLGPGVLNLAKRTFSGAEGLGGKKDAVVGWAPGRPALLVVEQDAGTEHDGPPRYRSSHPRP